MVDGNPLRIRRLDLPSSSRTDQLYVSLLKKMRKIDVDLYKNLTFKYQFAGLKNKAVGGPNPISIV